MADKILGLTSPVADGGVAFFYDTDNTLTSGTLQSWRNATSEKASIDFEGSFTGHDGTFSGDLTVAGVINAGSSGVHLEDDEKLTLGTGSDYWLSYSASGTALVLTSTNIDGAGADGPIFTVEDGTDDITFVGDITANLFTGNVTGAVTGNASTATALETARNINGVSFDGTANITVTANAETLTGTTLKSSVLASSLTSVGTLLDLTVTNTITGSISGNAATASAVDAGNLTGSTLAAGVLASSLTSLGTIASLVATTADINGGTIDATNIGATTPGTGAFTSLTNSGKTTWTDATGTTAMAGFRVTGDSVDRLAITAGGTIKLGPGDGAADVTLYRDAAASWSLDVGGNPQIGGEASYFEMVMNSQPAADGTLNLGAVGKKWAIIYGVDANLSNDLLMASGSILNFDSGDVTVTHSANTLTVAGGVLNAALNGTVGATTPAAVAGTTGAFSGAVGIAGNLTLSSNIILPGNGKVRLDGNLSGDTYLRESVANTVEMFVGGATSQTWLSTGTTVAGALTSTGDFDCNSKFNVTASTGALQMDGNLTVSGTGPHAIGGATSSYFKIKFSGPFTSSGSSDKAAILAVGAQLTGAPGDTASLAVVRIDREGVITQTATENIDDISSLQVGEPLITDNLTGGGVITNASTVLISNVPTEGASNWALRSVSGAWYNGGTLSQIGDFDVNTNKATVNATSGNALFAGTLEWGGGSSIASSDDVLSSDHAGIGMEGNTNAITIQAANLPVRIDDFDTDMPETVSDSDYANNMIVVGASVDYDIALSASLASAANNKVFRVGARSVSPTTQAITAATQADPCVVTVTGHGLSGGETVYIEGVVGMVELNGGLYKVVYIGVDTFSLDALDNTDVNAGGYTAYTSDGTIQEVDDTVSLAHTHQEYVSSGKGYNASVTTKAALTLGRQLMVFARGDDDATNCTVGDCYFSIMRI